MPEFSKPSSRLFLRPRFFASHHAAPYALRRSREQFAPQFAAASANDHGHQKAANRESSFHVGFGPT